MVYETDDDDVCPQCGLDQTETTAWQNLVQEIQAAGAHCDTGNCTEVLRWGDTWCSACGSSFAHGYWDEVEAMLANGELDASVCWSPPTPSPAGPTRRPCCGEVEEDCTCAQPITSVTVADFFASHDHSVVYADQSDVHEFCWSCTHWCSLTCPPLQSWAYGFFREDRNDGPISFFDADRVGCPFYLRDEFVIDDIDDEDDGPNAQVDREDRHES